MLLNKVSDPKFDISHISIPSAKYWHKPRPNNITNHHIGKCFFMLLDYHTSFSNTTMEVIIFTVNDISIQKSTLYLCSHPNSTLYDPPKTFTGQWYNYDFSKIILDIPNVQNKAATESKEEQEAINVKNTSQK